MQKKDTTKDCTNWENFKLGERCEFKHISDPDNKYKSQIIYLKKTGKDFSHTRLIREKKRKTLINSRRAGHVGLDERINNLEKNQTAEQHEKFYYQI